MATIKKFTPKFKELTFSTQKRFNSWLDSNTHVVIELKDNGQDLLKIWAHVTGEILDVNAQRTVWLGQSVDMDKLAEGQPLYFNGKEMDFIAEKITGKK